MFSLRFSGFLQTSSHPCSPFMFVNEALWLSVHGCGWGLPAGEGTSIWAQGNYGTRWLRMGGILGGSKCAFHGLSPHLPLGTTLHRNPPGDLVLVSWGSPELWVQNHWLLIRFSLRRHLDFSFVHCVKRTSTHLSSKMCWRSVCWNVFLFLVSLQVYSFPKLGGALLGKR